MPSRWRGASEGVASPLCAVRALVVGWLCLACVVASAAPASGVRQRVIFTERNYRLVAPGLERLHAGLVTVVVRHDASGEHGLVLFRLRRPLTRAQIVAGFAANDRDDFDPRGGVAVVPTGGSWEATLGLSPGRYLIADGGENGGKANYARGMLEMSGELNWDGTRPILARQTPPFREEQVWRPRFPG